MIIAALLTLLAAILGLVFSALVSAGVTRPVRQLLEGAKAVEAGHLDGTLVATSRDEIGHLDFSSSGTERANDALGNWAASALSGLARNCLYRDAG
jgi:HAMP domain-containing protein